MPIWFSSYLLSEKHQSTQYAWQDRKTMLNLQMNMLSLFAKYFFWLFNKDF